MGIYRERIFPILMNFVMDRSSFRDLRKKALKELDGVVLEIGFGTGPNLPFYPPTVQKVIATDPENFQKSIPASTPAPHLPVEVVQAPGERLPIESESVDHAVTTWTLCSVHDPARVLSEISRVLKPGGSYVFVEHGRAPSPFTSKLQDWLTPIQRRVGCGCNLNRRIDAIIRESPLKIECMENLYMDGPKIASYLYIGRARKPWAE